jgi:hypothetical protein
VGSTDAVVGSTAGAGDSAGAVSVGASVGSTVASVVVISVDSTELVSVAVTEVVSVLAVLLLVVSLLPHAVSISAAQRIAATAFAASLCVLCFIVGFPRFR